MMRRFLLLMLCALSAIAYAQDTRRGPDLQTVDDGFFDPTRKEAKPREEYHFGVEYRIHVGYNQADQRMMNDTNSVMYLHGARMGATCTMLLPLHFSLEAGVLYTLSYGVNQQHWHSMTAASAQPEYLKHRVLQHNLTIPIRAYYTIPLWQKLNMFFYAGPQLQLTLGEKDYMQQHLSEPALLWLEQNGIPTQPYDAVWTGKYYHTNIQMGLGGGMEWDRYRVVAGYDFGLNNRIKQRLVESQRMQEWSWFVGFSYRL